MDTSQLKQIFSSLAETFTQNSTIRKVYGDPIESQGKTIIPVAQVSFGFGGGFGSGSKRKDKDRFPDSPSPETNGDGGGGGGGLSAKPLGLIEVTPHATRFIRFNTSRYLLIGAAFGFAIGVLSRRSRRKREYPAL